MKGLIKKILREDISARIRRRVPPHEMEREFLDSFEMAVRLTEKRKVLTKHFLDELVYTTVTILMDSFHWNFVSTLPENEFWYDEIHNELENHYRDRIINMYLENQESNKNLNEVRVPRDERVEIYKDNNIIIVVPLTHRALRKYAHECQWCINSDIEEWEDYHKGRHAVVIQRNPKKLRIGMTGMPTATEILMYTRWGEGYTFNDVQDILGYEFESQKEADKYFSSLTGDINNFATNIVYYSPEYSVYDMEDNRIQDWGYTIFDIPNITPEIVDIMNEHLTQE